MENWLAVRVRFNRREDYPLPSQLQFSYLGYGGIYRKWRLIVSDMVYVGEPCMPAPVDINTDNIGQCKSLHNSMSKTKPKRPGKDVETP